MKKGLEDLKRNLKKYFDESNEKWRKNINMELGKMDTEVHALRKEVNEWKAKEGAQIAINENLRKEVEDLKRWREGYKTEVGKKDEEGGDIRAETKGEQGARNRDERNWNGLEWISEEKEREKRKNNLIIVVRKEIEVEVKIEKVWRVRTLSGKFLLGAQCGSETDKKEVMVSKKKLGDKEVYIENDLTWTERKIKERAWEKAMELKKKGKEATVVGLKKVKTYEGTWTWSEKKEKWFLDSEFKLQR